MLIKNKILVDRKAGLYQYELKCHRCGATEMLPELHRERDELLIAGLYCSKCEAEDVKQETSLKTAQKQAVSEEKKIVEKAAEDKKKEAERSTKHYREQELREKAEAKEKAERKKKREENRKK